MIRPVGSSANTQPVDGVYITATARAPTDVPVMPRIFAKNDGWFALTITSTALEFAVKLPDAGGLFTAIVTLPPLLKPLSAASCSAAVTYADGAGEGYASAAAPA